MTKLKKWHYIQEEEIVFKDSSDCRNGKYYQYDKDTFDYLLNDNDWVQNNEAWDELNWVLDQLDKMLESNDGEFIFIPTIRTATNIDSYYKLEDLNFIAKHAIVDF